MQNFYTLIIKNELSLDPPFDRHPSIHSATQNTQDERMLTSLSSIFYYTRFLFILCFLVTNTLLPYSSQKTIIMFDPAGDAHTLGRKLKHGYERGATLNMAEKIQQHFEQYEAIYPLLTRHAGDVTPRLQTASFANRCNAHLFIRLHVYHTQQPKPIVSIYYRVNNPLTDYAQRSYTTYHLIPLKHTHLLHLHQTKKCAFRLHLELSKPEHSPLLTCNQPIGLPLTRLVGVCSPAILIEIGINDENQLDQLISPLTNSIMGTVLQEELRKEKHQQPACLMH